MLLTPHTLKPIIVFLRPNAIAFVLLAKANPNQGLKPIKGKKITIMASITSRQTEVKSGLKACLLGFMAATSLGLTILPASADVTSSSRGESSAAASGSNSSVRQSIQQTNIQRSNGNTNSISIQDARNNASVNGDNNHVDQNIRQSNQQYLGGGGAAAQDNVSRQNAVNDADTNGNNNRIEQNVDQSIRRDIKH